MDLCRTCHCINADKNIRQLPEDIDSSKTCIDIFSFCLDIKVTLDNELTTALCEKCYSKIILFYKFKKFAIENEKRLKFLSNDVVKNEDFESDDNITYELINDTNSLINLETIKKENFHEDSVEYQSEEYLNLIQNVKRETLCEETKKTVLSTIKTKSKRDEVLQESKKENQYELNSKASSKKKQKKVKKRKSVIRKSYPCGSCDKIYNHSYTRKKHYNVVHLGVKKHCEICKKDVSDLNYHKKTVHDFSLRLHCDLCDKRFNNKSLLANHIKIHIKGKTYKCDICEKDFLLQIRLESHKRRVHDKVKPFLCQICSKAFFSGSQLRIHIRTHTKEKPYKCSECDKAFSTSTILKCHKETHVDVKAFSCNQCGKTFAVQKYLDNHMVTHKKERKFPCNFCDMNFFRTDHRRVHEKNIHKELLNRVANMVVGFNNK